MSEIRYCSSTCPGHEVADDGTFLTWDVIWERQEAAPFPRTQYLSDARHARLLQLQEKYRRREVPKEDNDEETHGTIGFIHYRDAVNEMNWLSTLQQYRVTLTEGERLSFYDFFESPDRPPAIA